MSRALFQLRNSLDYYEYGSGPGGVAISTADPFDSYSNWWIRRLAFIDSDLQLVLGRNRDYLFGNRQGDFFDLFTERGLLAPLGRPDTDFVRRWMVRESSTGNCYLVDFDTHVLDDPLQHMQAFVSLLDPAPVNRD